MDSAPPFVQFFTIENVWLALKLGYILAFLVYMVFAVVVVTQIRLMVNTLHCQMDGLIKTVGWLHLAVAILALLAAILIL